MEIEKIDQALEALLFVSGDPLSISDITNGLELQKSEVNASLKRLKEKYGEGSGIQLVVYGGKMQLVSSPEVRDAVETILNPIREKELTRAALETITIIAYKQPITRLELDQIRGVNSDYAVQVLLSNGLIEVVGRKDAIGKPLLYGTTIEFLKKFRLEDVRSLPNYDELIAQIQVVEAVKEGELFPDFELPPEQTPDFLADDPDVKLVGSDEQ